MVRVRDAYNLDGIRQLLLAVFTPEALAHFCRDHPAFHPLIADFGPGQGLNDMVDAVIDYCEKQRLWAQFLGQVRQRFPYEYTRFSAQFDPGAVLPDAPCPYRGLQPFEIEHAEFYFGREAMIKQLVSEAMSNSLITVVGASGCGKSSLIRAGLVAALSDRALRSDGVRVCIFRPGPDPFGALSTSLIEYVEPEITNVQRLAQAHKLADHLRRRLLSMSDVATRLRHKQPNLARLVLIVDQFEEVFTECREEPLREAFGELLLRASEETTITVVLVLRADFYGRVLLNRWLGEAGRAQFFTVFSMTQKELRDAIERPALMTGREFERGLTERILADVAGEPGNLPLLEFALTELWNLQTAQGLLTHEAYEKIGGVRKAIAWRAESIFNDLDKEGHGEIVQHILQRLTHYDQGIERTRRRVRLDELSTPRAPDDRVNLVVKRLADSRLLVTEWDEMIGAATVEVSHEALLQNWERLCRWLDDAHALGLWREKLASLLKTWKEANQDEGALLRGAPLSEAQKWLTEVSQDLHELERRFIEDSLDLREREAAEQAEQQRQKARLDAELRASSRLRRWVLGLGISILVAIVLVTAALVLLNVTAEERDLRATEVAIRSTTEAKAVFERDSRSTDVVLQNTQVAGIAVELDSAEQTRSTAIAAQTTAESEAFIRATAQALAESDRNLMDASRREAFVEKLAFASMSELEGNYELALLLAIEAERASHSLEADTALRLLFSHEGYPLVLLPGSKYEHISRASASWSPDGLRIVTIYQDFVPQLWYAGTGTKGSVLNVGEVRHIAWSPDGNHLVTVSTDDTARVWNAATGAKELTLSGHKENVLHAEWSPNGDRIVTAGADDTARVWDVKTGAVLAVLSGHTDDVSYVAWNRNTNWIVTVGKDETARVWDAETGIERTILGSRITDAKWSPDGRRIVTVQWDNVARVWDAETGAELVALVGHRDDIFHVAWNPTGSRIVTVSEDKTACIWNAETGAKVDTLYGQNGGLRYAMWSPDGKYILTSEDHAVQVWDLEARTEPFVLGCPTDTIENVAWSPDSCCVLTTGEEGAARVWHISSRGEVALFGTLGTWKHMYRAEWSPDGNHVVTSGTNGTARIWSTNTSNQVVEFADQTGDVKNAVWSPDGNRIAAAVEGGIARVWDAETGAEVVALNGHMGEVTYVAWSQDGTRIATSSEDDTARVWNAETGSELIKYTGHVSDTATGAWNHSNDVNTVDWSPRSNRIVTASNDGTAQVWDAETGASLAVLAGHRTEVLHAAWSPDGNHILTSSTDGMPRIWDVASGTVLAVLTTSYGEWVTHAAWSPNGKRIAGTGWVEIGCIWDANTGEEIAVLSGPRGDVTHIAWSPDSKYVVTSGWEDVARVWDAETGNEVAILVGHSNRVNHAVWSPDGHYIVTASQDGTSRVFYAPRIEVLLTAACERAVRNMSEAEWQQYMGDQPYWETCPGKPVPGRDY